MATTVRTSERQSNLLDPATKDSHKVRSADGRASHDVRIVVADLDSDVKVSKVVSQVTSKTKKTKKKSTILLTNQVKGSSLTKLRMNPSQTTALLKPLIPTNKMLNSSLSSKPSGRTSIARADSKSTPSLTLKSNMALASDLLAN